MSKSIGNARVGLSPRPICPIKTRQISLHGNETISDYMLPGSGTQTIHNVLTTVM
jgi:hypothetical protein